MDNNIMLTTKHAGVLPTRISSVDGAIDTEVKKTASGPMRSRRLTYFHLPSGNNMKSISVKI